VCRLSKHELTIERTNFLRAQAVVCSGASSAGFGASCLFGFGSTQRSCCFKTQTGRFCRDRGHKHTGEDFTFSTGYIYCAQWILRELQQKMCSSLQVHDQWPWTDYHYFVKTQDMQVCILDGLVFPNGQLWYSFLHCKCTQPTVHLCVLRVGGCGEQMSSSIQAS